MMLKAQKILVMRYRFIGDTVLMVPFLRNLRKAFPAARIDLMLEPFSGQVIEGCPYVDEVIPYEFKTVHKYIGTASRGKIAGSVHYRRLIKERSYDAVFVLKRSLSSALLVWSAGIKRRIGFATEGRQWFLTDPIPYRHDQHEVENFLDCLRALDIPIHSTELELWPSLENQKRAAELLEATGWESNQLKIVIHATASLPSKQWPLDRFAAVLKILQGRHQAKFIYTGAAGDHATYQELESMGPFQGLNLCGITSLRENCAVFSSAHLFFGVDSGTTHMAAAMGVPVVALFGPTNDIMWRPWGEGHAVITKHLSCSPCKPHKCDDNECMKRIGIPEALEAIEKQLNRINMKPRLC